MADAREFHTVVLAALLHDIGAFLRRGTADAFDATAAHQEVSARFVRAFADVFRPVADLDLLETLVRRHHDVNGPAGEPGAESAVLVAHLLGRLVAKADRLAAAEPEQHSADEQSSKPVPLATVFARVFADRRKAAVLSHHVASLTPPDRLSAAIFPAALPEYPSGELEDAVRAFRDRAKPLLGAVARDFESLVSHLLSLLATHTWAVPADGQDEVPDVSLYDHLRTTAAIAACLYRLHEAGPELEQIAPTQSDKPFCLAVGDVSGIQEYIFDVASGAAVGGGLAKRLRARSLFVQLIGELAPLLILRELRLPLCNIILSSGGKFYLLLPNLAETAHKLTGFQERVDHWLLHELQGSLGLNLASVAFDEAGFRSFGGVIGRATARLAERKEQRFRAGLMDGGLWRTEEFLLQPFGHDKRACPSCGKFSAPREADRLCEHCSKDGDWGGDLRRARHILFSEDATRSDRELIGAGVSLGRDLRSAGPGAAHVLCINDPDMRPAAAHPASFRYLVTHVPMANGEVTTFEQIAGRSAGRAYLSFLKVDVDRLGEVFAFGLAGKDAISRLTTLSRQLDLFFSAWLQRLLAAEFPSCYAVFSGGDDLFLVGPWDTILTCAERVREEFAAFVGHNPSLTLSAGVVIGPPRYPIREAAHEVEEVLKQSKQQGRNRITLLGHTLEWADWLKIKREWRMLGAENITSAFLYALLQYAEMWRSYRRGNVLGLRFQPLLAYSVSRNVDSRRSPTLYRWTKGLVEFQPGDAETELILDNLGLLAHLLILAKRGGEA